MFMEAMMRELASRSDEDAPKPPTFIAQALREEAAYYDRYVPFQVGDLVTARKGTPFKGEGEAHIVIAIIDEAEHDLSLGDIGSTGHGRRHDMRVLRWVNGCFFPFWVESACFKRWVDPHADVAASAAGSEPAAA
ncbi:hypothetical protein OMR07_12085 [Methylobacterium organophilum]|nr:hypothetical protein [Methylobacterium organophilum]